MIDGNILQTAQGSFDVNGRITVKSMVKEFRVYRMIQGRVAERVIHRMCVF